MKKHLLIVSLILLTLLSASCKRRQSETFTPSPEYIASPEYTAPPEMKYEVRTDYSGLTPYNPQISKYSRLHERALMELVPSQDYGTLLKYASASTLEDGSLRESKCGFVTIDGVIVTDLIYDEIERPYHYAGSTDTPRPVYRLSINKTGAYTYGIYPQTMYAACALDGSWITPFDYVSIVFLEDMAILIRDYDSFDWDIIDYNGKSLSRAIDCEWEKNVSKNAWPADLAYNTSEGYGCIRMKDDTYAFVDVLTGQAQYTDFINACPFSEGLAAVAVRAEGYKIIDELWGFIDHSFEFVIPPVYSYVSQFKNGRSIVNKPDGASQVINTRGETLLSAPSGGSIDQNYVDSGFIIYTGKEDIYYTNDLARIEFMPGLEPKDKNVYIQVLAGGWYTYETDGGTVLFSQDTKYVLPGQINISSITGESVVYGEYRDPDYWMGVMAFDGSDIIPPEPDASILPVTENGATKAFIVNYGSSFRYFFQSKAVYRTRICKLVDTAGDVIFSAPGFLQYDEEAGLYSVLGTDSFTWLDKDANVIISIPLMSYMLD